MASERILRSSRRETHAKPAQFITSSRAIVPRSNESRRGVDHGAQSPSRKKIRLQTPEPLSKGDAERYSIEFLSAGGISLVTDPVDRPAEPHITNAPLITPGGSRLLTYTKDTVDASPSKTGLPRPTTTTSNILENACAHLIRMDPRLKPVIDKHYCRPFCPEALAEECDPFHTLCSGIMAQQVSGAAASSIKQKFIGLFHEPPTGAQTVNDQTFPSPVQVSTCTVPFLRQAGLSERKAEYIKGLAEKFANGELNASMLVNATDEDVMEKLTAVRGLGRWSVEMFACFGLKRMDILSTGDLGVQ